MSFFFFAAQVRGKPSTHTNTQAIVFFFFLMSRKKVPHYRLRKSSAENSFGRGIFFILYSFEPIYDASALPSYQLF